MFCKPAVRKGILPQMLSEILSTRVMVKQAMKRNASNEPLRRLLDARQLGTIIATIALGGIERVVIIFLSILRLAQLRFCHRDTAFSKPAVTLSACFLRLIIQCEIFKNQTLTVR